MGPQVDNHGLGPRALRIVRDLAVFGLVFQVVHFIEHFAQLGYWMTHPTEAPWLTPWAITGRNWLIVDGTPASGNELLHLAGNLIFLGGLVALVVLAGRGARGEKIPFLSAAFWVQTAHVAEHLLLTGTYLAFGTAAGVTTLFGAASGAFGAGLRVWAHFLLNLVGTYLAIRAVAEMQKRGLLIPVRAKAETRPATT